MHKTGKVVRWEGERGFGFIRSPGTDADVFFHIRDCQGLTPQVGDVVSFEEIHVGGKGPRAVAVRPRGDAAEVRRAAASVDRAAARRPTRPAPRSFGADDPWLPWVLGAGALWFALLVGVVWRHGWPQWVLLAWWALNAWTYALYWQDKRAAQSGAWRIPEDTLHLWSLLGGWPGARWAQQRLRHKSRKGSFQAMYWATVAVHIVTVSGLSWVARA